MVHPTKYPACALETCGGEAGGNGAVKEPDSGRIHGSTHVHAVFREIHRRKAGVKERRRQQRLRRVEPLKHLFHLFTHGTGERFYCDIRDGDHSYKSFHKVHHIYIYLYTFNRLMQRREKGCGVNEVPVIT